MNSDIYSERKVHITLSYIYSLWIKVKTKKVSKRVMKKIIHIKNFKIYCWHHPQGKKFLEIR